MSKQYYEVEVEHHTIRKGRVFIKARGAGKANAQAEAALGWDDGRITWELGKTEVKMVDSVHTLAQKPNSDCIIGED